MIIVVCYDGKFREMRFLRVCSFRSDYPVVFLKGVLMSGVGYISCRCFRYAIEKIDVWYRTCCPSPSSGIPVFFMLRHRTKLSTTGIEIEIDFDFLFRF